jgi:hypothetical protein
MNACMYVFMHYVLRYYVRTYLCISVYVFAYPFVSVCMCVRKGWRHGGSGEVIALKFRVKRLTAGMSVGLVNRSRRNNVLLVENSRGSVSRAKRGLFVWIY